MSGIIWACLIGKLAAVWGKMDPIGDQYRDHYDEINRFMTMKCVKDDVQQQVRRFMHTCAQRHEHARTHRELVGWATESYDMCWLEGGHMDATIVACACGC